MSGTLPIIDFHAHILPGADHGSCGLEESLNQLALIKRAGVDTVVATPHFYPNLHKLEEFLPMVTSSAERLAAHIQDGPRICLGAEVLYCNGIHAMEGLDRLCLHGTNVLLLELPMDRWDQNLLDTVECLTRSYRVVLAHIDRYVSYEADHIAELLSLGAMAQINASSLSHFGDRRRLAPFLGSGRVVALGSDLHKADQKTYAAFLAAKKRLGPIYEQIMEQSASLLERAEFLS